jgi:hypothetical protein
MPATAPTIAHIENGGEQIKETGKSRLDPKEETGQRERDVGDRTVTYL